MYAYEHRSTFRIGFIECLSRCGRIIGFYLYSGPDTAQNHHNPLCFGSVAGPMWSVFGRTGYQAQPSPPEDQKLQQKEQKTEAQLREEILERDARLKCRRMGMGNHITAWGALYKLKKHPIHRAKLTEMGYSVFFSR